MRKENEFLVENLNSPVKERHTIQQQQNKEKKKPKQTTTVRKTYTEKD